MSEKRNYSKYVQDEEEQQQQQQSSQQQQTKRKSRFGAGPTQEELLEDMEGGVHEDALEQNKKRIIAEREDKYHQRKKVRQVLSPERHDAITNLDMTPNINTRSYGEIMTEQRILNEKQQIDMKISKDKELQLKIAKQRKEEDMKKKRQIQQDSAKAITMREEASFNFNDTTSTQEGTDWEEKGKSSSMLSSTNVNVQKANRSRWDQHTPRNIEEQQTPGRIYGETPTPGHMVGDQTPGGLKFGQTPTPKRLGKSRWDATPYQGGGVTPSGIGMTPTPGQSSFNLQQGTPIYGGTPMVTPGNFQQLKLERELDERNKYLSDEELNQIIPLEGYEIMKAPDSYQPLRNQAQKLTGTPSQSMMQMQQQQMGTPGGASAYYHLPQEQANKPYEIPGTPSNMPTIKPEDFGYFGALLNQVKEEELSLEEQKERKIMMLLLKIKNGTAPMRKAALRQITVNARELGAGALFNQILPLLMSPTLEDQERHLLVKVVDRILFKLDDLVRPFVHKVLVVIEPLLIDEDYYARVEGREIISNLCKAAGLNAMISTMRPDIDHSDEYVRNTTARAFAVVASALGVPALLPFLKAVCASKKSWSARHTAIKIVQQIAILMGCAVLPHLKQLVDIIEPGLKDEQQKVRTITALAMAALAEAATPYGIEAFENVLIELYNGIQTHRGKGLAALLKAVGYIIPLMEPDNAAAFTHMVMDAALLREFENQEQEMIKIVLKVVKQCVACEGLDALYVKQKIVPKYFLNFWVNRMSLDRRNYKQLVDTTVEIAQKVGGEFIIQKIVEDLKHDSEPFRKMTMEAIEKIIQILGVNDIGGRLEIQLMDGIIHSFQEQSSDDTITMLNGFGTVINCLGARAKPYFNQVCGIIQWRLSNKSAKIRQQAADLISRIAMCMKNCNEEGRLGRLSVMLYEILGEEYPEVLGSILGGLKAIVNVIGMTKMTPPIKDLLPRLTPILKNRHEKVQENCIDLIGRIADRGSEYVSPKEWMRICFDLLELLKAHKKGIRRATVNTFGYIAKAIGPQDVLVTLLNNLKVQERQNRVCTTVAIAIVAETCGPFTVLPSLMNEYRVQELNVQNGVLKSLSFMFEYIGEMSKDYIYAVVKLLEDALIDRDLVHRQIACNSVKHLALGVQGLSCEDALLHLLNYVWPNIFEVSPHVVNAVTEAVEAIKVSLGPAYIMQYLYQGLFHPARRVREVYWKFYNILYISSQDALVPCYPLLDKIDHSSKVFANHENYIML